MRRAFRWLLILVVLAGAGYGGWWWWEQRQASQTQANAERTGGAPGGGQAGGGGGRGRRGPGGAGGVRIPVTVAEAARREVALTVDALGTVQPLESVVVRTQLDGQLTEVLFREGQEVEKGQILARVDDRTVAAALAQAEAKRALDVAQLNNARVDLRRYEGLVRASGATQQQLDTQRATVAQFEAQVRQDEAAIEQARTQVSFATIRAPLAGRVGIRQVDPGNIVRGSDTNGIVTVTQMAPIGVTFTLPQQELPRLMRALAQGPVPIETLPGPGGNMPVLRGTVLTVDNAVDATTGTIRAKATFPNEDRALWPGAFVNLRLRIEVVPDATVIPLVSVQRGPEGPFTFVLKEDQTVEQRNVTVGPMTQTDAVIRQGIRPGERVVTSGGLRLSNNTAVAVADENRQAPPGGTDQPQQRRRRQAQNETPRARE
ncbi:efflux RND transporter periplasmic adaptor subunit [Muricoccus radiodurans]|uniref:efflux RND transporter periplasmic adaptor subunit n=1 Tax=Muricoccus radiodurans TaxID=2231721 RepID=UPI003CEDE044